MVGFRNDFPVKFCPARIIPETQGDLSNVKQDDGETLLVYIDRFKKVLDEIKGLNNDTVFTSFGFKSSALAIQL